MLYKIGFFPFHHASTFRNEIFFLKKKTNLIMLITNITIDIVAYDLHSSSNQQFFCNQLKIRKAVLRWTCSPGQNLEGSSWHAAEPVEQEDPKPASVAVQRWSWCTALKLWWQVAQTNECGYEWCSTKKKNMEKM